jgi:amidase
MKPTVGLVSRSGIIPIAHSQDTAGPVTRSVADLAVLLTAMAGTDPRDVATRDTRTAQSIDYRRYLDPAGLRGARIGVARKRYAGYSTHADAALADALTAMKEHGAVIVDPADIATAGQFDDAEYEVLLYEFKADLEAYLRGLPTGVRARTLDDLIAFNRAHAASELPYFGQEIFEQAAKKGPLSSPDYRKALAKCRDLARTKGLDATFARYKLDALVAPTQGPPALIDLVNGDPGGGGSSTVCGGGLSRDHGTDGLRVRAPARRHLHGPRVERAEAREVRICLRAGDEGAPAAAVPAHGGARQLMRLR